MSKQPIEADLPEWVPTHQIAGLVGLSRDRVLKKARKEGVGELRPYFNGQGVADAVHAPRAWVLALIRERASAKAAAV